MSDGPGLNSDIGLNTDVTGADMDAAGYELTRTSDGKLVWGPKPGYDPKENDQ